MRRRLSQWVLLGLLCNLMLAGIAHAGPLDNGVYTADYTVLKAEDDSASMANDYWEKPARITMKDGLATIQLTINHSKWVTEFKVPGGGGYVDTRIISTDEASDKRTVQFAAADISQPILSKIHVTVAEIDYDHDYTIRLVFKPESIQLIEAAESPKNPDPPAETASAAEQPASPAKPPAAAEQPAAGQVGGSKPQEPAASASSVPPPPATTTGTVSQDKPAASAAPAEEPPAAAAGPGTPAEEGAGTSVAAEQTGTAAAEPAVTEPPAEEAAAPETDTAVQEEESPAAEPVGSSETEQSAIALSAAPAQAGDSSSSAKLWLFVGIAVTGAAILAAAGILIYRRRLAAREV
ncbi:heme uptake protein IsdC [Paenibacillus sp. 1P07SE]|uniref:heme uptake protein IsdC n=1 Tax=Paenibacillus sp. 1P07SE TaxID=3132209 RepID=UPI0039A4DA91